MRAVTGAGKKIAAARVRAKLTGKELAERAAVTPSWIRSVETGRTAQPAPDKLARVARELGLDLRELLALTDQLGAAAMVTTPAQPAAADPSLITALNRQSAAIEDLVTTLRLAFGALDARTQERAEAIVEMLVDIRRAVVPSNTGNGDGSLDAREPRTAGPT